MPDSSTRHHDSPRAASGGGIDMQTLWITAAASAAAAYVCSQIWAPGTLAAAAFTPVLVAIIKEGLAKSTKAVTQAVPVRGVVRSARPEGPQPYDPDEPPTPTPPAPGEDAAERVSQLGEIQYHGTGRGTRGLRVAIVTGLLGFVIAAAIFTVPELVAGGSAAGGGRGTTIFGGTKHKRRAPVVTTTTTTETKTVTTPPQRTVTLPPPKTVTQTVPVPTTTQPPPAQTTATPPPPGAEPAVPEPPTAQPPG